MLAVTTVQANSGLMQAEVVVVDLLGSTGAITIQAPNHMVEVVGQIS